MLYNKIYIFNKHIDCVIVKKQTLLKVYLITYTVFIIKYTIYP